MNCPQNVLPERNPRVLRRTAAVFFAAFILVFAGCSSPDESGTAAIRTPAASDYDITGLERIFNGFPEPVTITPKNGKSGGSITVYYNDSKTVPSAVGSYTVTFDVTAAPGWNAASGLKAGTMTVSEVTEFIRLGSGVWADGNIAAPDGAQWFKFTATAATHYLHFDPGTLNSAEAQLYGITEPAVGEKASLNGYSSYTLRALIPGNEYYIKVTGDYSSGDYKIGLNESATPPSIALPVTGITALAADKWADGNIAPSNGEQWFKFTATAAAQYIHFKPGTLEWADIRLYDSSGAMVTEQANLSGNLSAFQTLTSGDEYYIRVKSIYNGSGAYRILFSLLPMLPDTIITTLSVDTWGNGNIAALNEEQWFKFTATADNQYIHFEPGALYHAYIQLYNSAGAAVGEPADLYDGNRSALRTLTSGGEYFIRVKSLSSVGAYRIGFRALPIPPDTNITALTVDTWGSGNIAALDGDQWFKFTAAADNQYIHFGPDTLKNVYIQLYDSTGGIVGNQIYFSGSTNYVSLTLTSGNEYYIKVMPLNGRGEYMIAFSSVFLSPATTVTRLIAGTWANGKTTNYIKEQWFKFTATAVAHYIHFDPVDLTSGYIQLYDITGKTVGDQAYLSRNPSFAFRTLTTGVEYYVKVTPNSNSNGAFRIAFNVLPVPPNTAVTQLDADTWANGTIVSSDAQKVQWFKFTATEDNQYIHFEPGSGFMTNVSLQLYDDAGGITGGRSLSGISHTLWTITSGNDYYIKVTPSSSQDWGTFNIAFNGFILPPNTTVTALSDSIWANCDIGGGSGKEQWFKFTATAERQYIHFAPGALNNVNVQLYNSSGSAVGSQSNLYNISRYTFRTLEIGNEYYIRVASNSNNGGAYKLLFNASPMPPNTTVTTLADRTWAYGNITSSNGAQWFKFTATAARQYIYFAEIPSILSGRLTSVYVQLYGSAYEVVGSQVNLSSGGISREIYQTLTTGAEYYIKVTPTTNTDNGAYMIGVNELSLPLFTNETTLSLNTWTDGNITSSSGVQWFRFIATAARQYIHAEAEGAFNNVYIQMYDSAGATVERASGSAFWPLTSGNEYFLKVTNSNSSGAYKIGFNNAFLTPSITVTALPENKMVSGFIGKGHGGVFEGGEQWFTFTATAETQYIHFAPDNMLGVDVRLYTSANVMVGERSRLYDPYREKNQHTSRTLTIGNDYYLKVTAFSSDDGGYYWIGFNASTTHP